VPDPRAAPTLDLYMRDLVPTLPGWAWSQQTERAEEARKAMS
jgi:hypothetical protein